MSSFHILYVYENNASLIEAGFIRGIPSTCTLMKITRCLNRSCIHDSYHKLYVPYNWSTGGMSGR